MPIIISFNKIHRPLDTISKIRVSMGFMWTYLPEIEILAFNVLTFYNYDMGPTYMSRHLVASIYPKLANN